MGLNFIERQGLRLVYSRVERKIGVNTVKKWLPLVGSFVVLSTVVMRYLGHAGTADAIDSVAKAIGLTNASVVDVTLVLGAVAGLVGQGLKVWAEIQKARA